MGFVRKNSKSDNTLAQSLSLVSRKLFGYKSRNSLIYKWFYLALRFWWKKQRLKKEKFFECACLIVSHCNLNCRGCNTFSPLCDSSDNGAMFVDVTSFERDIERFALIAGDNCQINLQGGEPLLHPDLIKFLEITRKYIKLGDIVLITNGLLLTVQEKSFWEACKRYKIKIRITPYPIKLNVEQIKEVANSYLVDVEYLPGDKGEDADRDVFYKIPLCIDGNNHGAATNHKKCGKWPCVCLLDGKFWMCQVPAIINRFNSYFGKDFKISNHDYLDIFKIKDVDEILDFMCNPSPFCGYCDTHNMEFFQWGVSKRKIEEWT